MRIVFDNIIFSLQTCGGISGMFSRLIEGLMKVPALELYFLERKDANRNVFRRRLNIPQERIISIDKYPLKIQRYINPGGISKYFGKGKRFIFHSSYYRYCTDPEAINISTLHDFTYEVMHMRGRVATYVHSRQKSNALSHSAAIACVSRSTLHDFYRFVGARENQKIEVIPNAPLCTPTTNTTSLQAANEVLFVGARAHHKNFLLAVEALQDSPYKLVLCSSELSGEEKEFVARHLRPEQFQHIIYPDQQQLSDRYARSLCLIYPSSYEGFGIPILEAQLHGLPVITGSCPSSLEVSGGASLVLEEYSAKALRKAVDEIGNMQVRTRLAGAGFQNAARYNWNNIVGSYLNLYTSLFPEK